MRFRHHLILRALVACVLSVSSARAAKTPHADAIAHVSPVRIGPAAPPPYGCYLGVGSPTSGFTGGFSGLIFPPDDEYYTLLRDSDCVVANCYQGAPILGLSATALLYFPTQCTISGYLVIVPSNGDPVCPSPITSQLLCDPAPFTLDPQGVLNTPLAFEIPIAPGCAWTNDVFIGFIYTQTSCPGGEPGNLYLAPCANCVEFNIYPGNPAPGTDLCPLLSSFGLGNPIYYATVVKLCFPDATTPHSWGRVKQLYR